MTPQDLKASVKKAFSTQFRAGLIACLAVGLAIFSFSINSPFAAKAAAAGSVTVTPASWSAPITKVGSTSATSQIFVFTNSDSVTETLIINRNGSGDFQVDNTGVTGPACVLGVNTILPATNCSIRFVFRPSTVNSNITAQLFLSGTPDTPAPAVINLNGEGYNDNTVVLTTDSAHLAVANGGSLVQTYTYTNNSPNAVTLDQPPAITSPSGTYTLNTGSCGTAIAAYGGQCSFTVAFQPGTAGGDVSATFPLTTTPATNALSVTRNDSVIVLPTLPVTSFSFTRTLGQPLDANSSKPVQVVNNDAAHAVTLASSVGTTDFSVTNCGPIPAGGSCNLTVDFTPSAPGTCTDTLTVNYVINTPNGTYNSNANGTALTAGLQGVASAAGATPTPTPTATSTPTNTPTPTPTKPAGVPNTPKPGSGGGNTIGGLVTVDDQPVSGFSVKIDGADTREGITGDDGRYNFDNLPGGTYTVILTYDHSKYKAISQDRYTQTLTGGEIEKGINFRLQSIATAEPTTPAQTTAPVETTAPATTEAPVSPAPTPSPGTGGAPSCPTVEAGQWLRLATKTNQQGSNQFSICIKVIAGKDGVDLSHTVVVHLPQGASVGQTQAGTGTVNVNGSTVEWGGYSLAAQQSTTLVIDVTAPTLNGTNIVISGRFNRGQSFQQTIDGLPPLVEIPETDAVVATPVRPVGGGQGGGQGTSSNPVIPSAPPATGTGATTTGNDFGPLALVGLLMALSATLGGLALKLAFGRKTR